MHHWLKKVAVLVALPLFLICPVVADAENIDTFEATYEVHADGRVSVTEEIVYDFASLDRRGIFRVLEKKHPQAASSWLKRRTVNIEVNGVWRNGLPEPYKITEHSDEIEIRIGEPDVYHTGSHTYLLEYTLYGALSYGSDGAELYWNTTGHAWQVPILLAKAQVVAEKGLLVEHEQACYAGVKGSTERCAVILENADAIDTRVSFFAAPLVPGQGMTIAQAVNRDLIVEMTVEEWSLVWLLLIIVPLSVLGFVIYIYRRQTHNKPNAPIIVQYEPYEDLLPMYTGVVFDGRLDAHDITAGIVYLAEQGFIKIKHIETKALGIFSQGDYELTQLRFIEEAPNEPLRILLSVIFSVPKKNGSWSFLNSFFGLAHKDGEAILGRAVLVSELSQAGVLSAVKIASIRKIFLRRLRKQGYMEHPRLALRLEDVWWLGIATTSTLIIAQQFGLVAFFVVAVGGIVILVVALMPRRTRKGYEARFHLLGFKQFLSVTDAERFKFHNAPEKSPELFMKFLPYAIALKVEKEWAKAFEGITMPNPAWYEGARVSAFSAAAFTNDLSAFSSSFASSSGTRGSSGGGSSGGGGGGGGGGSW